MVLKGGAQPVLTIFFLGGDILWIIRMVLIRFTCFQVDVVVRLCNVTNESLYRGIEQAVVGNRLGDISYAIQRYTEVENTS